MEVSWLGAFASAFHFGTAYRLSKDRDYLIDNLSTDMLPQVKDESKTTGCPIRVPGLIDYQAALGSRAVDLGWPLKVYSTVSVQTPPLVAGGVS
jgi:hypothetical protein